MYLGLGPDEEARQTAYRALFPGYFEDRDLEEIRACLQSGTPLGNDRFREEEEGMLKVKVRPPDLGDFDMTPVHKMRGKHTSVTVDGCGSLAARLVPT
jgi:hypothetical protein